MLIYDKTGKQITIGDFIVYGHAIDRSAALRFGKVLAIKPRQKRFPNDPGVSIAVIGVDGDWSHREPSLNSRFGTLQFSVRVVVLEPERIPTKSKVLLDSFVWDKK